jgi:hypothetical protein
MNAANKARTAEVKPLEREKKEIGAWNSWKCSKQFWKLGRKLWTNWGKKGIVGICQLRTEKILAILGINQAAYHGGNLNGKNVQQMFQESDKIVLQFQELLLRVDEEDG